MDPYSAKSGLHVISTLGERREIKRQRKLAQVAKALEQSVYRDDGWKLVNEC